MTQYKTYNNDLTFNEYLVKTFVEMTKGLTITTLVAFVFSFFFIDIVMFLRGAYTWLSFGLLLAELFCAYKLSSSLNSLSNTNTKAYYYGYCVLTGLSLSSIFVLYTDVVLWLSFGLTALMFATMAFIGHNTKTDLTQFGGIVRTGLIGLIIASLVNMFFQSDTMTWLVSYAGIIIFMFIIAYDIQTLRNYYTMGFYSNELGEKAMVIGAFQLYLDFINLFIRILRILSMSRDRN
ncbi:MAG: Bax inhibitor-1/YccA family protein [Erysipelotrichaceae bacterium]|nr:Bax inhibitor-1/YccA family protein [Erysipelotrichaceae bacterium]